MKTNDFCQPSKIRQTLLEMVLLRSLLLGISVIPFAKSQTAFDSCLSDGGYHVTQSVCLPSNYSKYQPPDRQTLVKVRLYLEYVKEINEAEMTISSRIMMQLDWLEPRMILDQIRGSLIKEPNVFESADPKTVDTIWRPVLYIDSIVEFKGNHFKSCVLIPTWWICFRANHYG